MQVNDLSKETDVYGYVFRHKKKNGMQPATYAWLTVELKNLLFRCGLSGLLAEGKYR
jgi:hypothetical protein